MSSYTARGGAGGAPAGGRVDTEDDDVSVTSDARRGGGGVGAVAATQFLKTLKPGDATHYPAKGQTCRIRYTGRLEDGTQFDSRQYEFRLGAGQVIAGLEDALPRMSRGQIALVRVPPERAYGQRGYPPVIPPGTALMFEIELVAFD
jgi:FKBP-type peptidyl-prolyl cis-trans isomerase